MDFSLCFRPSNFCRSIRKGSKYERQRLEPLAGSIGLLALVHSTRLTDSYDLDQEY